MNSDICNKFKYATISYSAIHIGNIHIGVCLNTCKNILLQSGKGLIQFYLYERNLLKMKAIFSFKYFEIVLLNTSV